MRALLFLLLFTPIITFSEEFSPFEIISHWGYGESQAVFNEPGKIYLSKGSVLEFLDYDPSTGFESHGNILLSGGITSISILDTLAFVACGNKGVEIINIRSRRHAQRISTLPIPGFVVSVIATDVFVHSPLLFILTEQDGLFIYDLSLLTNAQQIGYYEISDYGKDLFFDPSLLRLYCAEYNAGLEVIDVSTPSNPGSLGRYNSSGLAYGVYVQDNRAYLADYHKGLRVIDVANPAAMTQIVNFTTHGNAYDVVVWDTVAVVAEGDAGIEMIDLTEKNYPKTIELRGNGAATTLSHCNHQVFVPTGSAGLQIVQIDWNYSYVQYQILSQGISRALALKDQTLYIAAGNGGLMALSLENPANPTLLTHYTISQGYGRDVAISDTLAFLAANEGGVYIFGVSQPSAPHLLAQIIPPSGSSYGVFVHNDTLYVANGSYGINIYSVSNPRNPIELARFTTAYKALDVVVKNNIAYISDYLQGLQIYDVSDYQNIHHLGTTDVPVNGLQVFIQDTLAYLAAKQSGLRIIDITSPNQPHEIQYFRATDFSSTRGVVVRDSLIILADGKEGLHAAIYHDSKEITLQGEFLTGDLTYDVLFLDTLIVAAAKNSGIFVLNYHQPATVDISYTRKGPLSFRLGQNYPNPFNPRTQIPFSLPYPANVTLEIFNAQGQKISTLLDNAPFPSGKHRAIFSGNGLSSGVYFYRLRVKEEQRIGKMLFIK